MELSVEEVARQLKMSKQYARRIMKCGKLKSINRNGSWYTTQKDINSFLATEDYVIDPEDRIRKSSALPKIIALSFFSGAMGLDIGIKNAGIQPLLACEINKNARATIVTNDSNIGLIGDIWKCSPERIRKYARIPKNKKIDLIFGGPPCQAFSTAGKRKGFSDARGNVFIRYLDIICEMKPKFKVGKE